MSEFASVALNSHKHSQQFNASPGNANNHSPLAFPQPLVSFFAQTPDGCFSSRRGQLCLQ